MGRCRYLGRQRRSSGAHPCEMLGGTFTNANGGTLDLAGGRVTFQSNSTLFFNEEGGTVDISGNSQFSIGSLSIFVSDPTAVVWINAGRLPASTHH